MTAKIKKILSKPELLLSWAMQAYFFYYFSGHLIYYHEFVNFPMMSLLAPICFIGIILQIIFLTSANSLAGFGVCISWYLIYYANPFVAAVSYPIFAFFFLMTLLVQLKQVLPSHKKIITESFIIFLGLHYFISGLLKLFVPEWNSGEALAAIIKPPTGQNWFYDFSKENLSQFFLNYFSKVIITFEMLAILILVKSCRKFVYPLLMLYHILLVITLNLVQLTIPYFIILLWLFQELEKNPVATDRRESLIARIKN